MIDFSIYEDIFKFSKTIFWIIFIVLIVGTNYIVLNLRDKNVKKELVMKGLAYYTNDVNGEVIFKLKEIK